MNSKYVTRLEKIEKFNSPFLRPFDDFRSELSIIEEMNKSLPKSVVKVRKELFSDWQRLAKRLSDHELAELGQFFDLARDRFAKTAVAHGLEEGEPDTRVYLASIRSRKVGDALMTLVRAVTYPDRFNEFIRNMTLVYLISIFEHFLEEMLEIAFHERPEALIPFQTTLSTEELIKAETIETVQQGLVKKAIQNVMRGNIDDICDGLRKRCSIALSAFKGWGEFKERFYRRNLIVHRSRRANDAYKKKVGHTDLVKVTGVPDSYLIRSIRIFEEMSLNLLEAFHFKFSKT